MKEKLADIYERLQSVTIMATKSNLETMLSVLYDLEDVHGKLEKMGVDDNAPDAG